MHKEKIFKAYDIRGEYGTEFDDEFAKKLGTVLAEHLDAEKIVVSRDIRESSAALAEKVIEGIASMGVDVADIGVTSTPLFYFGVISEAADGGVMVTASHLGEEFNGFKITREKAISIGGDEFWEETKDLFEKDPEVADEPGNVKKSDLLDEYIGTSVGHSGVEDGEINIPVRLAGNKIVLKEIKAILDDVGVEIVDKGEQIGFEFDADGDRVVVLDSSGDKIRGDLVGGFLAGHYSGGKKVVYDIRYSRGVLEYLKSKNIKLIPSRAGHTLIKAVMRENDAEFCAEHSGHIYFKEMGYAEASGLAVLKILKAMGETGKSINELTDGVSSWSTTDEINFKLDSREKIGEILEKVEKKYSDGEADDMDGLKIQYPDWGFVLRPSNTEPKLRLIVDAKTDGLMEEKKEELMNILR